MVRLDGFKGLHLTRPLGSPLDPLFKQLNLLLVQSLALGWHLLTRVPAFDAFYQVTLARVPGDQRWKPSVTAAKQRQSLVNSQTCLLLVRPVTL